MTTPPTTAADLDSGGAIDADANWSLIPAHMHDALRAYVEQRRPPGHFLAAVLSNDLRAAVARADDVNALALRGYVVFLYNYVPMGCWGSPAAVRDWTKGTQA